MTGQTTVPMPGLTRLTAVAPTPTGVIRAVEERLDALERDVRSARDALERLRALIEAIDKHSDRP